VFLDPPYAQLPEVPPIIAALLKADTFSAAARVVVEHAKKDPAPARCPASTSPTRAFTARPPVSLYQRAEG